ncbi:E3 ubiquitin-protein ligase SlrP [Variovorax sp. PBL-H6]|uniref:NEL-type E3 ubiquitin ligase domain-containing protein n=1 Tax=Variovorax sp. PBL-H6 TaxID=434009 RepID=UPI0013166F28|nr:NEL-type E3 ubiquitin ligase domain-containing protein [Variovorax sp. PBL-H6]VTU24646.1 E3 ubiquitin-protein ligase SlrP [Variovorax sp. PBL-H6]
MGENIGVGMAAGRAKGIIEVGSHHCLIIEIGLDLDEARTKLQSRVPADAMVFLITDAPLDEVATVRAALPSPENIIDEVKVDDSVDVIAPLVYRALDNLLDTRPVTPTAAALHLPRTEYASASVQDPGLAVQASYVYRYISHDSHWLWIPMGSERATNWRATGGEPASPAVAANPTTALSKALDLGQGFCESPEWQQLAQAQDLALLANLVTKALKETKNPNLKPMLRRLVEEAVAKPTLAERVFVVLQGGDESCVDRVSHALYRAQEEWLAQPVWDGALNHDLPKVIDIARQVFRRRCIDDLAQQTVKDINKERRAANRPEHTEEIETHLAYLAGLHESLELGGEQPDARFTGFGISGVTDEDIKIAKRAVLTQEGERFWDFLATWEPWQRVVLPAHFPDEAAGIVKALSDPDRPGRLQREATKEVDSANVPPKLHQESITLTANQRGKDEELQLWMELTRKAWSTQ